MSPTNFERTLVLLGKVRYSFIGLDRFHGHMAGRALVPPKALLISFDGGYAGMHAYAHPALARHRVPAVAFPALKWFSPHPRPERYRPHLTAEQAREMLASGLWAFGCHSYTRATVNTCRGAKSPTPQIFIPK